MKLTAASTAASVAISALPSDTGDAVSKKLMDLNSKFLIVLCAVMLEKYLLTITGFCLYVHHHNDHSFYLYLQSERQPCHNRACFFRGP